MEKPVSEALGMAETEAKEACQDSPFRHTGRCPRKAVEGIMTLDEYAMQRMWESIAKDDVKEAAFWLGLLAEPESQNEKVH